MTSVYAGIIANPADSALNLQYALLAEGRGEYRKALAAYERVLINDPDNEAARRGLQRVRRLIEPAVTSTTFNFGIGADTNPLRSQSGSDADAYAFGSVRIRDERVAAGHRWRTLFGAYGQGWTHEDQLNYGNLTAETGPLIDLEGSLLTFRPSVGAGAAMFRGEFYYWDVNAAALLEGHLQGAHQWVRARVGYRQYGESFTADEGAYADLAARLAFADTLHQGDVFAILPRLRWNGIEGMPQNGNEDFAPGLYVQAGSHFEYTVPLGEAMAAAANFRVHQRWYRDVGMGSREDFFVSPGAALIFPGLFGVQTDLRIDYRYEHNDSNDDAHDWQNHAVKVGVSVRR